MFLFDVPAGWLALVNPWWMPLNLGLIAALIALAYLTYHHGAMGVVGIAVILPLYVARARVGWLPTTFLELAFLACLGSWIAATMVHREWRLGSDPLRGPIVALIAAGTVTLVWSPDLPAAAGLWKAYLVEPILLYWFARQTLGTDRQRQAVVIALGVSAVLVSLLVLAQWVTGVGIAEPGWVRFDRRRVTGFFTSPNAVGLYLGPIVALLAGWAAAAGRTVRERLATAAVIVVGLAAIAATRSAGTWLGLAVAAVAFSRQRPRARRILLMGGVVLAILLALPVSRGWLAAQRHDPGWVNRVTLWRGTIHYLTASPQVFLQGAGIAGFSRVHEQFRDPRQSEPLIYPHNLVLNFWVEYGLLGLVAVGWLVWRVVRLSRGLPWANDGIRNGAMLALTTMLGHGIVDVPYFKNDLAMLTWLLLALALPKRERPPRGSLAH